jgi:hypothetical protein
MSSCHFAQSSTQHAHQIKFKFIYSLLSLKSRRHDHDLTARLRARRTPTALHGHDVCSASAPINKRSPSGYRGRQKKDRQAAEIRNQRQADRLVCCSHRFRSGCCVLPLQKKGTVTSREELHQPIVEFHQQQFLQQSPLSKAYLREKLVPKTSRVYP